MVKFRQLSKEQQEEEHSLEMHLPFVKLVGAENCTVVPVMVGDMASDAMFEQYAQLFNQYFAQDNTVFVVSTDFCHWGKRFSYQPYRKEDGLIHESIAKLDKEGIDKIEAQDFGYYRVTKGFQGLLGHDREHHLREEPGAAALEGTVRLKAGP
jgi:AmmeMemoRadiSam system protein B